MQNMQICEYITTWCSMHIERNREHFPLVFLHYDRESMVNRSCHSTSVTCHSETLQHFDIHCNPSAFSCGLKRTAWCHSVSWVKPTWGLNAAGRIVQPALQCWHLCVCERETMCVRESTNNNVMPIPDKSICCWQVLRDDRSKAITSSTIVCRVPPTGCAWIQILACFGINNTAFSDSYNIWADIGGSWVFDIFFVPHWLWTCGPMISWKVDFPNQQKSNISPWVPFIIDLISHSLQVS
jgi:hypothetical protein